MIKRKARRRTQPIQPVHQVITQNGFGHEIPPELALVQIYFDQQDLAEEASRFFDFYRGNGWRGPTGKPYRNWKVLATAWIKKITH